MARETSARWPFVACVVLQTVIFGLGNAITKMAYESITPLWCLAIRFGLAAAVFAVFFGPRIVRQLREVRVRDWLPAAVCMALAYLTCNVALDLTTATNVGFLVALPVVFAPLLSSLANRRRYPLAFLPFQAAVVVGLYLLCNNGGALSFGWGEALALLSSVALAGALVFGEQGLQKLDAATVAGTQIGVSFAVALACALAFEPPVDLTAVQPVAWGTVAFLALLSTCLTFMLQNVSLTGLPSSTVSLLLTGEPVFTAAFSFVLLGEALSVAGFAGAALIVASVAAATWVEGRQAAPPVQAPASQLQAVPHPFEWAEGTGRELPQAVLAERRVLASDRAA
ncbi:DMT family transporter [Arabiibacter massiliensis]|uniref:DMT family transporter n=1 Tax=Arabiibacter massiliensis TaxID=1870985 RepID=UPI0009BA7C30|nr:EamA family transporter [Arabiibacter massiliensis]